MKVACILLVTIVFFQILISGCSTQDLHIELKPHFSKLVNVPNLSGEIRIGVEVGEGEIEEISVTSLQIGQDNTARASIGDLPAGKELLVNIDWYSGSYLVANVLEPKSIRLEKGKEATLTFAANDYIYPDSDGDGALNIHEAVFESQNPDLENGAVEDSEVAPTGFFNGFVGAVAIDGNPMGIEVLSGASDMALITSADVDQLQDGTVVYSNHKINVVETETRLRNNIEILCSVDSDPYMVAKSPKLDFIEVAVVCGSKVLLYSGFPSIAAIEETPVNLFNPVYKIAYSASGNRLYALHSDHGEISVIDTEYNSPTYGQKVATIASEMIGENSRISNLVDNGKLLIVTDAEGGLIVLSHQNDENQTLVGRIFSESEVLTKPSQVVLHPSGQMLYVTDNESGKLLALDVGSENIADWQIVEEIEIGLNVVDLVIDPLHGFWVYALTIERIIRINSLTNEIEWNRKLSKDQRGLLFDMAIGFDGKKGMITVADSRGSLMLGAVNTSSQEAEDNDEPSQLNGEANMIDSFPARIVGWGEQQDSGSVSFDTWAMGDTGRVDFSDDIEDLWQLDLSAQSGNVAGTLAIGLFPTSSYSRVNLSLMDSEGTILQQAVYPVGAMSLSTGTGIFMVTDVVSNIPEGALLGVGTRDYGMATNYGPYEIVVMPLNSQIIEKEEIEPNNDAETAQLQTTFPVVINGVAQVGDTGGYVVYGADDAEDCYQVRVDSSRLAISLDFEENHDLDVFILDMEGNRIVGQYGLIGPGQSEYFVFEPYVQDPYLYLVCVNIDETSNPSEAAYRLTFIDFDY
jgi:hypothetical protein